MKLLHISLENGQRRNREEAEGRGLRVSLCSDSDKNGC